MSRSPIVSSFLIAFAGIPLCAQVRLGSVDIGESKTASVTVTVANAGRLASLAVVTGGAGEMDFANAGGGTCQIGKFYEANATCTVHVRFTPQSSGNRLGGVSLADNNSSPMATVYFSGIGMGPQAVFLPARQVPVVGSLNNVADVSVDASSNVYVAESETYPDENPGGPEIPGGLYKATFSGKNQYAVDNIGEALIDPVGVAVDGDGNVLEADAILSSWIDPRQGTAGSLPGYFHAEKGLAVDSQGYIYSAGYGAVYKSSPAFASTQIYAAVVTGLGTVRSLAVDAAGNVYVPDSGPVPAVYKEVPNESGGYRQEKIGHGWIQPVGIAVDANGTVYVNDSGTVYSETPQPTGGYVKAALLSSQGNGTAPAGQSAGSPSGLPAGLAVDGSGSLYVPVYSGPGPYGPSYEIDKFDRSAPPVLSFASTPVASTSSDSPRTVTVTNFGNQPLQFESLAYPQSFPESRKWIANRCTATTSLPAGASCNISVEFAPQGDSHSATETVNERIEIVTNTLNAHSKVQIVPLTGIKTPEPVVQTPVILQASGTYTATQAIVIADATPGATIYYTLDGKTPSPANAFVYSGPRVVSASATLKAVAYAPGQLPSSIAAATYRFVAAKPTIFPAGGTYTGPVKVTISGATPGATIFYTTNGTQPNANSKIYTGPITVSATQHVIAIAARTGFTESEAVKQVYTIATPAN